MSDLNPSMYYTARQAAPLMGLHPKTVQQMCTRRQIECYKPGRAYLLRGDVIQAWITAHTIKPVNPLRAVRCA